MDLNQLYHDHQVSLIRADRECGDLEPCAHRSEALRLGALIEVRQTLLGAPAAGWSVQLAVAS